MRAAMGTVNHAAASALFSTRNERGECRAVRAAASGGGKRSEGGGARCVLQQTCPEHIVRASRRGQGTGVKQNECSDDDNPRERGDAKIVRPTRAAMRARLGKSTAM
jgi:hypothetical protein